MKNLILKSLVLLSLVGCGNDVILNKERNYLEEKSKILYYKGSPLNGHLIEYYDDELTKLKSTYTFKEGLQIGPYETYHFFGNNELKEKGNYNTFFQNEPFNVYKDGWIETYHQNGQLSWKRFSRGSSFSTKEDISYYENGQLEEKGNYSQKFLDDDGTYEYVKTGLWEGYFEDGTERLKELYDDNGNKIGLNYEYKKEKGGKYLFSYEEYENSQIKFSISRTDYNFPEYSVWDYEKGTFKSIITFNLNTDSEFESDKGFINESGTFKYIIDSNGKRKIVKDGLWKSWGKMGYLFSIKLYKMGKVSKETIYDEWGGVRERIISYKIDVNNKNYHNEYDGSEKILSSERRLSNENWMKILNELTSDMMKN